MLLDIFINGKRHIRVISMLDQNLWGRRVKIARRYARHVNIRRSMTGPYRFF